LKALALPASANASGESMRQLQRADAFSCTFLVANKHRGRYPDFLESLVETVRGASCASFDIRGVEMSDLGLNRLFLLLW